MKILKLKITKHNFQYFAEQQGYIINSEFKFSKKRRFRADWKANKNDACVLIEYDGYNQSGLSRHGTLVGRSKDCEKYNLATLEGYHYLCYTKLNFDNVFKDLEEYFKQ